jgi:23S rRNA pseudouridine1911/1915/1917 synthase
LDGLRADVGAARLFGLSRSAVDQAAERGQLYVDSVAVTKSARLRPGSMLEVVSEPPRVVEVRPAVVDDMVVVYSDADLVVVDKPAMVAAHPSLGWQGPSVVEHLAAAGFPLCEYGPPERKGIVSRLDVGTSGLMVVALSDLAYVSLKRAFTEHEVRKVYYCLVQGYPNPPIGTIDAPIGHAGTGQWKMAVTSDGRHAVTHYEVIETLFGASLVRVRIDTGRTHQIRVHMSAIRHPCVGDVLYGADPRLAEQVGLSRQWLHAVELGFVHPRSGEFVEFTSSYPADLRHALEVLRAEH